MHFTVAAFSLQFSSLLSATPGNIAQGLIWGIMALGVYITFRLLDVADLSVDGTFTTGAAVTVALVYFAGVNLWLALACAVLAGVLAGFVTGVLHTRLGIPAILAGILTQFGLYSVNLRIIGSAHLAFKYGMKLPVSLSNAPKTILIVGLFGFGLISLMYWYFGTEQGSAIRSTGSNPAMSRAQGINTDTMKVIGLALSNGVVALSGGLMAQFSNAADINMGRGAIVIGLAAVVIGEVLCDAIFRKGTNFYVRLTFVLLGGVVYYILMGVILWLNLKTDDLKLFTAVLVAVFLAVPYLQKQRVSSFRNAGKLSAKRRRELAAAKKEEN